MRKSRYDVHLRAVAAASCCVLFVAAAFVAGCYPVRDVASSPVAVSEERPTGASVSEERHTGAFAVGASLSFDAALKPLDPSPVKDIRIDVSHKVIDLAPGVKYSAWTLGDQVPGPSVRVRVGDRVRFSMLAHAWRTAALAWMSLR